MTVLCNNGDKWLIKKFKSLDCVVLFGKPNPLLDWSRQASGPFPNLAQHGKLEEPEFGAVQPGDGGLDVA